MDEPTWRCRQNPFIRALRIQEPVILREPEDILCGSQKMKGIQELVNRLAEGNASAGNRILKAFWLSS